MIELLSTETKPVYIGYNKLAADVAEATTDALTGADYIALQATIKYLWFMVILLAVVALLALVVAVIAKGRADRLDRQLILKTGRAKAMPRGFVSSQKVSYPCRKITLPAVLSVFPRALFDTLT